MQRQEIRWQSANSASYAKSLTGLVVAPDRLGPGTGAMLFSHGWGGNRFQHEDKMLVAAEAFDLVCLSAEFRQSGFDFDPETGAGWDVPYDASFMQVVDVLNGLRRVLELFPGLDRQRLFHYGGSQGGHLALLSAIYAPRTFAWVYATSPVTHLAPQMQEWAGRHFAAHELRARQVEAFADRIECPVWLEHGMADPTVPWEPHTGSLAHRLEALGKEVEVVFHPGGDHGLAPVTNRLVTFRERAPGPLSTLRRRGPDDFALGSAVTLECGDRILIVDWSRPAADPALIRWQ
jgi:predicted esterase